MADLKKEEGYILVAIIGILTILSLMTITFATLSRIETRATRNYADSVKCEMVAKAGLEHAIYVLRQDKFGDDDVAYNNDNTDSNYDYYDPSGDTSWPGDGIFDGSDYDNNGNGSNDSAWIYFPATTSSLDIRLPGNLRARYAVLITDDREARANINATGNHPGGGAHISNEGWSTFEFDLSDLIEREVGNGEAIANSIIDARFGTDTLPGATGDDDPGKIPDPQNDGIDNDGDWNIGNDSNGNGIPDSGESNVDELNEYEDEAGEFNPIFPIGDDVPFGLLSEAEIMGTSSYESRLEEKFTTGGISQAAQGAFKGYLTTYSADTILCPPYTLDSGTSTTMLNINALVNNEGAYTGGYYDSDKKVEMIMDVLNVTGGLTGSSGSSNYVERHQLAVNIKDFIDSDDTVTIYNDGTDDYYGIERTPYINEVEAWTSSGADEFIELFNPYDTAINIANWTITLDGDTTTITLTGPTIVSQDYYVIADQAGAGVDQVDTAGINNLDNGGEELILRDSSGNTIQVTNYGSANQNDTCSLNDPRPIPLTATASDPWSWTTNSSNTIGAQNSNFDPTVGGDDWTGGTWTLSFLVANRRFSNKGYLGFIHNGRQWSSFLVDSSITYPNVLQYFTVTDPSMDNIDNDGDGDIDTYDTDGDGDIDINDTGDTSFQSGDFDGQEHRIPGLINVNTASTQVLQSLPNIDSTIATAIQGSVNKPFTSIGDLVDDVTQITGVGTKWDKEKTFRSISNLITTRSNVFTVYVTAQVIDEAISSVYAEKRILAIVDRSVNPIRVRYFRWLVE